MAYMADDMDSFFILQHFVGVSVTSLDFYSMLERFCQELKRKFELPRPIPTPGIDLVQTWPLFLQVH